jgi:hypothetical protein
VSSTRGAGGAAGGCSGTRGRSGKHVEVSTGVCECVVGDVAGRAGLMRVQVVISEIAQIAI